MVQAISLFDQVFCRVLESQIDQKLESSIFEKNCTFVSFSFGKAKKIKRLNKALSRPLENC
ncbi:MAG: hypothetical protein MJ157_04060 [Clostridia bacterium]|nr:hypothetical protein [Clostridia bacterium]